MQYHQTVAMAVPESILKKRRTQEALLAQKVAATAAAKKAARKKRGETVKRAEKYVKEYTKLENDQIRLRREAKAAGSFYVPAEAKVAFVMRIRGINGVSPK
ncbi:hypothetical protein VYU27_010291, partial [Nannochloropsis oceanica]